MMKQRSNNSATYKEYQERSALTQKHFRKKNTAAIDSYEEAVKYINEHIKAYYIDGKAPKRSELQAMSLELKEKYNVLVPEHNAFLRKQTAATSILVRYESILKPNNSRNATGSTKRESVLSRKRKMNLNRKGTYL